MNDGGPEFPPCAAQGQFVHQGMSLRDYMAVHAPEPREIDITNVYENDRMRNPHGDYYKPHRRNREEIIADLRYAYADAMLERRTV